MTMIQAHINIHKCDFDRGVLLSEFNEIVAIEELKELGERVRTIRPEEGNILIKCNQRLGFPRAE